MDDRQPSKGSFIVATPSQLLMARWLLASQKGDGGRALAAPEAAQHVFELLNRRLADLITANGAEALLARAVHVAASDYPFLERASTPPGGALPARLRESADGVDPGVAPAGFLAVLATMIALLAAFIGEDLTLRLLRDVWPRLPVSRSEPESANGRVGGSA